MSQVVTFYSYKGGVGRSMALANTATLLARWGYKVLVIDWDLEAPGIDNFFTAYTKVLKKPLVKGLIDLLYSFQKDKTTVDWKEMLTSIVFEKGEQIDLILSGNYSEGYFKKVREFDINSFYEDHDGGKQLENFRNEIKEVYDFILIDSRTGITESGGICTIHMPDINVLLFTATEQGLKGIIETGVKAMAQQQNLPYDRQKLVCLPIASRLDTQTEYQITQDWITQFIEKLQVFYKDWIPINVDKKRFIELSKIPYIPYFSYGEKLPVIEQGTSDPSSIGFAYESIAGLIANKLEKVELLIEKRDSFLETAKKPVTPILDKIDIPKQKGGKNIFISSSHKDYKFTSQLTAYLKVLQRTSNIEIILDTESIMPGQDWDSAITEMINRCDIVLAIVSANYLSSDSLDHEIKYAIDKKKTVIPIYAGAFDKNAFSHSPLSKVQGIFIDESNLDESLAAAVRSIKLVLDYNNSNA